MSERKVKVPEGMLRAAEKEASFLPYIRIADAEAVIEVALRWLSENPPEFSEAQYVASQRYCDGHSWPEMRYPFTVAFLVPEEEIPEEDRVTEGEALSALATYENSIRCGTNKKNAMANAIEWLNAYRRGRESR